MSKKNLSMSKNSSQRQKLLNNINQGSKFINGTDTKAGNFNTYFIEICLHFVNKISISMVNFDTYLNSICYIFQFRNALTINELKDNFTH